ncbi:endonuclease/exonuclease/phosphatase family protein [Pimelobacter sp. 30-1]|uniref:endonuclease/exonuclease/phosphatase family protein n=1 Tax=Pimelobacter sp. 30-1 TaxID=2004991 RepID=UPI001C046B68|nr:endonuclease/exonuclease/phosphatase family protein [Pimelobacter sp. 30-1]
MPRLRSDLGIVLLSVVIAAVVVLAQIPGVAGTIGAATLPWAGFLLVPLVLLALLRRSWSSLAAPVALVLWAVALAPVLPAVLSSRPDADGTPVTFASQNVEARSGTSAESARTLAGLDSDVIALTEMDASARAEAAEALATSHPYAYTAGTVGLWSVYPLSNTEGLTLGLSWKRALRADVAAPGGRVRVYVVHAASVRPGQQAGRDAMLSNLADLIDADDSPRLVAMGDFNAATTDPALKGVRRNLSEPRSTGLSFGFTWPARFPLVRIDHIFERGLTVLETRVAKAGSSDHRAVLATFDD